ncbi:hypothetical protein [Pararhodobacter sp.]|uniref:hypothetical protein n=1 Tax=Pararhodobacter sp. TaxID=2127056 RepID=UPI002AFF33F1|nr:hypothetical protein [Pararhodobacter sp.]
MRLRISSIFELAGPIFILLSFARFYVVNPNAQLLVAVLILAIGSAYAVLAASIGSFNVSISLVMAAFLTLSLVNSIAGNNFSVISALQFSANMGYAWAIARSPLPARLYLVVTLVLVLIFVAHGVSGVDPEEVFSISRNYISTLMVLSVSLYYISCGRNRLQPRSVVPISMALVCLWGIGRSGIISSIIVLAGTVFLSKAGNRIKFAMAAVVVAISILMIPQAQNLVETLSTGIERFERLSDSGPDARELVISEYIGQVTERIGYLLFAPPAEGVQAIVALDGNPHNAYISLHLSFGLLGILLFLSLAIYSFWKLTWSGNHYASLALLVSMFRSFFDSTAFHGPLDVAIFSCIFIVLLRVNTRAP